MQERYEKDKSSYLYRVGEKVSKEKEREIALTLRAIVMFDIIPK